MREGLVEMKVPIGGCEGMKVGLVERQGNEGGTF